MIKEQELIEGSGKVELSGELTIYAAAEFKTQLEKYLDKGVCKAMTLDMSNVVEIDTSCVQVLMQLKKEFVNSNRDLKIVSHSPSVIELFELYNLFGFFDDPVVLTN